MTKVNEYLKNETGAVVVDWVFPVGLLLFAFFAAFPIKFMATMSSAGSINANLEFSEVSDCGRCISQASHTD